jgi:hypothetical protein
VPASNTDVARTILALVQPENPLKLRFPGRVLTESLRGYEQRPMPQPQTRVVSSKPSPEGLVTEVHLQTLGGVEYFDAAGFPGWTIGIQYKQPPLGWRWWEWDWPLPRSMSIQISPGSPRRTEP